MRLKDLKPEPLVAEPEPVHNRLMPGLPVTPVTYSLVVVTP